MHKLYIAVTCITELLTELHMIQILNKNLNIKNNCKNCGLDKRTGSKTRIRKTYIKHKTVPPNTQYTLPYN